MAELDRYIPGVPCWIDTTQPDPNAAAEFYAGAVRLGARGHDARPTLPATTYRRRLHGGLVAAVSSQMGERPAAAAVWNTYIWVDSADETAAKVREAGGSGR